MKHYTAVLIDDEISALKGLELKLRKLLPDIEIVETFSKPETALEWLINNSPDLVFLDIEMPRLNGFELLSGLKEINFQVIFVTAYSEYALQALKHSAVDYILKPIENEELIEAVDKAVRIIEMKDREAAQLRLIKLLQETLSNNNKLVVPTAKGLSFIPMDEIIHLEGDEGYTRIHLNDTGFVLSSYSLGRFEKMLTSVFFKCHKSHIINIEKARSFENEGYIVMDDKQRVPISKPNRKIFLGLFK